MTGPPSRSGVARLHLAAALASAASAAGSIDPALLGLAANAFVPGLVAGVGSWLLLRRAKRGGGANITCYALYWFLPDFVLRLKATPPSHVRRFVA